MNTEISTTSKIRFLAKLMQASSTNDPNKVVFFFGAGAPREAGLPLADELRDSVAEEVFGTDVPESIKNGRLEDVFELFQSLGGKDGYKLVANAMIPYRQPPPSYHLLADLIRNNYVSAVFTTNFDVLFDEIVEANGLSTTVFISDSDFENGQINPGTTLIGKLHGSASDPSTIKGSWTDTTKGLPKGKERILTHFCANNTTVFVGYAGKDTDILKVLDAIPRMAPDTRIFWVDPEVSPGETIRKVLKSFNSGHCCPR